jgi:hypothetical protein
MANFMQGVRGMLQLTWGAPRPGRETDALRHLEDTIKYFHSRVQSGRVELPRFFIDTMGNSSESMGMILVEGEIEDLFALLFDKDYQGRMVTAASLAHNFTTRYWVAGAMADDVRAVYGKSVAAFKTP